MKYTIPALIAIVAAFSLLTPNQVHADNTYRALMTGCTECSSCKKKVVMSFAELDGVESVRFLKEKEDGLYQLIVETSGDKQISAEQAEAALKHLPHYEIKLWQVRLN